MEATATFRILAWDEKPYDEMEGRPKFTRASVKKTFAGDIEGESTVEYLMAHRLDGAATFVGLERIVGTVGGRSGSCVLQHTGTYENGTATAVCTLVTGAGTGDLTGLRGEGGFATAHAETHDFTLTYEFD